MSELEQVITWLRTYEGHDILKDWHVDYTDQVPSCGAVFPQGLQHASLVQGCGGMEQRKEDEFLHVKGLPAYPSDADLALQERLRGPISEGADQFRLNQSDLPQEKRFAGVDFLRFRVAIIGRATFDHVGDVDIRPGQPHRLQ